MESPKFKFIQKEINDTFDRKLLREEWKKRIGYQLRKQIVFDPIEYRDFSANLDGMISQIRVEIGGGTYQVRPVRRYLVEKSRGLCRMMTAIHPRDLLVLERLARSMYFELKQKAPSKSSFFEPDDGNFKKGFEQSDIGYGSFASWKRFQKVVFGFAKENEFIVVTDIANFYDFINFQHMRNVISSLADLRESLLDLLIYLLNRLSWTPDFMPLTQVGMPQLESTATRVLANAMLYEVDRVCESSAVGNYARFMDDIDVGTSSEYEAKCIIRDIDLTLQSRQLRLNSNKTKIFTREDAFFHFCINENIFLSRLSAVIEKKKLRRTVRKIAEARYEIWLKRERDQPGEDSAFLRGNGSKIHKYMLRLLHECDSRIPDGDLLWLIEHSPGMRSTAFKYLAHTKSPNGALVRLWSIMRSKCFIDDSAPVDLSGFLLHARFRKTDRCRALVTDIIERLVLHGGFGLSCAILFGSRFLEHEQLLDILSNNKTALSNDFWLSRAAAGVAPLFYGKQPGWSNYLEVIRSLKNDEADSVIAFHLNLAENDSFDLATKAYLIAQNKSFPQMIFFPKVLCALSACKNQRQSQFARKILEAHPALRSDPHYRSMGFN